MKRIVRSLILPLALAAAATACDPSSQTPLPPRPDASPVADRGVTPIRDAEAPREDAAVDLDLGPDAALTDATTGDADVGADAADAAADAMPADLGVPGGPPPRFRATVLTGSTDAWVAWARGGRLFARRLPDGAEPGPILDVAAAEGLTASLLGVRTRSGPPWVLLPDPADGQLRAHDVSDPDRAPVPLGLWQPAQVVLRGSTTLVVGAAGPGDATTVLRTLDDVGSGTTLPDLRGVPAPAAMVAALGRLVLGFDTGICVTADEAARTDALGEHWRCRAQAGAVAVGGGEQLYFVGPVDDRLVMWSGMPGATVDPHAPDAPLVVLEGAGSTLTAGHPLPDGRVLIETEGPEPPTFWLLEDDEVRRVSVGAVDDVLGLATFRKRVLLVRWNEGMPVLEEAIPEAGPAPPTYVKPAGCDISITPEDCSPNDQNCDGRPTDELCCSESDVDTRLPLPMDVLPEPGWQVSISDAGLLITVQTGDIIRIFVRARADDSRVTATQVGEFQGVGKMIALANRRVRTVIHVHNEAPGPPPEADAGVPDAGADAGPDATPDAADADAALPADMGPADELPADELLWFFDRDNLGRSPAPCVPVALHVLDTDGTARVLCADRAVDVAPFGASEVPRPYPVADVRWIATAARGQDDRLLVATGDAYTLAQWRMNSDGFAVIDEPLPADVEAMTPADRARPFRLPLSEGDPAARVRDERFVEVFVPRLGWRPSPSTRWPREARLLRHRALAVSAADTLSPDQADGRIAFYVHDLSARGSIWGRRFVTRGTETTPSFVYWGMAAPDHDPGLGDRSEPLVWRGLGTNPVDLEGFRSSCLTSPPAP